MIVTFSCPVYSDITMFGDIALNLIKRMGHTETVPGAILAEDIPAALEQLKKGLESASAAKPAVQNTSSDEDNEPVISLAQRAIPLIEMLEEAARAKRNVMWKSGT